MRLITLLRYFYSACFYLLLPWILLRLLWRSRRNPAYRQRLGERFGFSALRLEKSIWIHAVSVGESLIAVALIKKLRLHYPGLPIVVTTMTPTGAARIQAALGDSVFHVYIPYDLPAAIQRFLQRAKPVMAIIMETELWPNFFAACRQAKLPLVVANGRLSVRSYTGYRRIAWFTREMLAAVSLLMAQSRADADRFIALGMNPGHVVVTGNIKFDLELPADLEVRADVLRRHLGEERLIWVAASTHAGEEDIILKAQAAIIEKEPQALLIVVPRHPERFTAVAELITKQGFQVARRSLGETCGPGTAVYLGDTMGEMFLFYAVSALGFVGGSFVPVGGHNLLEPAALAKPVLSGPILFNFTEIAELLTQAKGLTIVKEAADLATAVLHLFADADLRQQQGKNALQVVAANRGALAKHIDLITELIG
jgi:3-deoxy-D-manno-octulosonic-acid transferase